MGFELAGFVRRNGPDLQVRGLQTDDIILLWLKSPKLTWLYARMGIEPAEQPDGRLVLTDVPEGTWSAEWLDTLTNRWTGRSSVEALRGRLDLRTPPIRRSLAVRLYRQTTPGGGIPGEEKEKDR